MNRANTLTFAENRETRKPMRQLARARWRLIVAAMLALAALLAGVAAPAGASTAAETRSAAAMELRNVAYPHMCLDAMWEDGGRNGTRIQLWGCLPNQDNQRWSWDGNPNHPRGARLINVAYPGMCLDAMWEGGGRNGTRIQLWECLPNQDNQRWTWRRDSNGFFKLVNVAYPGMCLDAMWEDGGRNGTRIQLWEWVTNQTNQAWL